MCTDAYITGFHVLTCPLHKTKSPTAGSCISQTFAGLHMNMYVIERVYWI